MTATTVMIAMTGQLTGAAPTGIETATTNGGAIEGETVTVTKSAPA
ncbi:hypothetical protein [Pseudorhizobium flavum]|uniref:Uncharacterized protein n=1 Tax=Pseudorhizobium flavum TaxID=1335061 RepID=A0A7X0DF94_9HYPH|nr:hypothetical protein [Pseudorhizobium flavum]MBB6182615.1 hypothetical protein [Pseudorhizobium flavum]CAD6630355.1 hypothetical protein RFYW14_04249 [Pseudorhizobium flavum]